jgi:hypothetical protein
MRHYVIVHQKKGLRDLYDEYPTAEEARNAIAEIGKNLSGTFIGVVVTPSKNVSFNAEDFGGAEYKPDESDELGSREAEE